MEFIYNFIKGTVSILLDNWQTGIKILVAVYFITTGLTLLAGAGIAGLPGINMTLPM